jgi:GTP pyrophosphokinase
MPTTSRKPSPPPVAPPRRDLGFEDVLERLRATGRPVDEALLRDVHSFSEAAHREQKRLSGDPFYTHPLQVAWLLADWKFDEICVAGGLLHDVLEDTLSTREALEERFGREVAELVDGVTKIGRHAYVRRDQVQAETFRKMILASSKDIRVILVKLADRLHNLQTADHLPAETRRRVAQETLEIYAPIAHRLGMSKVKGDLEDLAFYHLYPHQFAALHGELEERLRLGQTLNRKISERLAAALAEAGIPAEISSRVKRYYSIWQKLRRQEVDIAQLYDYLAFRIVTESLRDSYAALGVVHQIWRPIPGRFKDYIAMPKPNLYQSLHTTLVGDRGQPFEVQIRTREMDRIAEEGIAAHWSYKEGREGRADTDGNIVWLRQLLEVQQEVEDPRAFLTSLKVDLYPDEVYAFTPKGEVFSFPQNATPLDFAYRVHTDLGHRCAGARVNGRLVPIRTPLKNGDIVEILTSPNRTPSRDWLGFVATSRAKSKIRQWLSSEQKKRSLEIGRRILEKELRDFKVSARRVLEGERMRQYLADQGLARLDDLLSRLAYGKAAVADVLRAVLSPEELAEPAPKPSRLRAAVSKILPFGAASGPIAIKGQGDLLTFLAKCCSPLPGDEIVGYVTRGRGVSVHSVDCPNVKNLFYDPEREIEVEWAREAGGTYPVALTVETEDRPGMIAKLTESIADLETNIRQLEAETSETGRGLIDVIVEVRDRRHLEKIRQALRAVSGVLNVERRPGATARRAEGGGG